MAKEMTTENEAIEELRQAMNDSVGGRWMFVLWRIDVKDDGNATVELKKRITWQFPMGDYDACLKQLEQAFADEKKATEPAVPAPLEMADFLEKEDASLENVPVIADDIMRDEKTMSELFNKEGGE